MPRERRRRHPDSLLKSKMVAELGYASIFIDPNVKSDTEFKIIYDKETGSYMIECSPLYVSVMEAIEEVESRF